jgi:hypothetical protein
VKPHRKLVLAHERHCQDDDEGCASDEYDEYHRHVWIGISMKGDVTDVKGTLAQWDRDEECLGGVFRAMMVVIMDLRSMCQSPTSTKPELARAGLRI